MRFLSSLVLVVFIAFLSTPTIVSMIEESVDTTIFYSLSEEEQAHKDAKSVFKFEAGSMLFDLAQSVSGLILSENLSKHDNVSSSIFIPPPNQA